MVELHTDIDDTQPIIFFSKQFVNVDDPKTIFSPWIAWTKEQTESLQRFDIETRISGNVFSARSGSTLSPLLKISSNCMWSPLWCPGDWISWKPSPHSILKTRMNGFVSSSRSGRQNMGKPSSSYWICTMESSTAAVFNSGSCLILRTFLQS